jgi:hypothetical protein
MKHFNFVKKASILLGAIAASSFFGLSALAESTPTLRQNGVPDAAAPGRDFPNQSDPRAGRPGANSNTGVSAAPITSGPASEYNYRRQPSRNRPANRPNQSRPSSQSDSNGALTNPAANQSKPSNSNTQFRPAPSATPDPAAPGTREFQNQSDPRSGLPETKTPSQSK